MESHSSYGSTSTSPIHKKSTSSSSHLNLDCVPEDSTVHFETRSYSDSEDETEEIDARLEENGLYRGSYYRLLALYTLAPLISLVTFTFFAVLPRILYRSTFSIYPYSSLLPFPFPEILTSISLWSLAYISRENICSLIIHLSDCFPTPIPVLLSTSLHSTLSLLLQQIALPLLLVSLDNTAPSARITVTNPAFIRVWWIALGWALSESVVAVKQGYDNIALYRDVLVTVHNQSDTEAHPESTMKEPASSPDSTPTCRGDSASPTMLDLHDYNDNGENPEFEERDERRPLLSSRSSIGHIMCVVDEDFKLQVDQDINELIALKNREELEEMYGIPMIRIPVFISCLQRINSFLISLGVCLLLSHAYICSPIASLNSISNTTRGADYTYAPLLVTFPIVATIQFGLAVLHTPMVLPLLGVPTVAYTGSLVSLGTFFAGLGVWEGLG